MNQNPNSTLTKTWKEQIRQVAARNPRLAQELWQNRPVYFERYAYYYRQLAALPRKVRRKFLKRLTMTLSGVALLLALGQALPAWAAAITVDGVVCTLAEAITSANNDDAAGNGCVDGSGADVIDLQTDVTHLDILPYITSEITLEGNLYTIDGNNTFRVIDVFPYGNLTLNDAIVTGGFSMGSGGGIRNYGILTINDSTLSGNSSQFQAGGAILNGDTSTVTINHSTISDNSANEGGGIASRGILTLNNSTISGNSAELRGGGIHNYFVGIVTINNSTVSGNSASYRGGGIFNDGTTTVNNSTITGNSSDFQGGGIFNSFVDDYADVLNLNCSLISGNSASSGAEVYNYDNSTYYLYGIVNANQFNVVGYGGDARSSGFTPGALDIIPSGPLTTVLDTTLADNGGFTFTHALVSGSVAIDAAPNAPCLAPPINGIDQRGYARNLNGNGIRSCNECDAGAFEFSPEAPPTPTPRPTRTPTPAPLAVQSSSLLPLADEEAANSQIRLGLVILLALGNLVWFRKRRN